MDQLILFLVLPLAMCLCFNIEVTGETFDKIMGSKTDVTPICTNSTSSIITLIVCKIRTERSREGCRLLYQHGHDFEHKCDSRFKFMKENHTVYLHLMNLLPVDSGIYTCECVHPDGVYTLHLNVTVKEDKDFRSSPQRMLIQWALIGAAVFIIIAGVTLGLICRTKSYRGHSSLATSGSSECKTPKSLDQDGPDDYYISLQHTASDIYQSVSKSVSKTGTVLMDNQKISSRESDPTYTLYENI